MLNIFKAELWEIMSGELKGVFVYPSTFKPTNVALGTETLMIK